MIGKGSGITSLPGDGRANLILNEEVEFKIPTMRTHATIVYSAVRYYVVLRDGLY